MKSVLVLRAVTENGTTALAKALSGQLTEEEMLAALKPGKI